MRKVGASSAIPLHLDLVGLACAMKARQIGPHLIVLWLGELGYTISLRPLPQKTSRESNVSERERAISFSI